MKKFFCNIKFIALVFALASCAPKAKNKAAPTDLKTQEPIFKTKNEDRQLNVESDSFDIRKTIGITRAQNAQEPWLQDSSDIFHLAEKTIMMGDFFKDDKRLQYKKFGHDLIKLFYSKTENATQFDKHHTMYLPAALGFEDDKIKASIAKIGDPENVPKVQATFDSLKIQWPEEQPTLHPSKFIESIEAYLINTGNDFQKRGVTKSFVTKFRDQVQKDYMGILDQGKKDLENTDEKQRLGTNVDQINKVLASLTFIPKEKIDKILSSLNRAHDYAVLLDKKEADDGESLPDRLVKVIANIWLDLNPEQREKFIKPVSAELYEGLSGRSDKILNALAGRLNLGADLGIFELMIAKNRLISGFKVSCHPQVHDKLLSWVDFTGAQKTDFRNKEPDLFEIFSHYSQKEIKEEILASYEGKEFSVWFGDQGTRKRFIRELAVYCVNTVDDTIDTALNKYVLQELDKQIREVGPMLEKIVADKTMGSLNEVVDGLSSNEKFEEYFEKQAMKHPLVADVFNQETLPGLENNQVSLFISAQNKFSTKNNSNGNFQTGAEVLGASLAANALRMQELKEFEVANPKNPEFYKVIFPQINKMLSMIGFKDIDHKVVPSMNRLFYGKHLEMDIFRYDCNQAKLEKQQAQKAAGEKIQWREDCTGATDFNDDYYAIPDELAIEGGAFSPKDNVFPRVASVEAQAEVVRGASMMLNYFKDWKGVPDDYDVGMGAEKFGEDVLIFPRPAFVNLTVGLSTTPIRGFKKSHSPVVLFKMNGDKVPEGEIPKDLSDILQAAIINYSSEGRSPTVTLPGLVSYMIAIDEFLQATNGIENTKASVVNPPPEEKKNHDVRDAILEGRKQLKLLMFGINNFIIGRLQAPDGGFYHSYSLTQMQVEDKDRPRTLEDQELAIQGLMRMYKVWGSEIAHGGALEAYYFMNQRLWNEQNGFYFADETGKKDEISPNVYLDTLFAVGQISKNLTGASQVQAQKIFDFYSNQFLQWNQNNQPLMMDAP